MKVSEQLVPISNGFDVSNHTFVNQIMNGLQQEITETVPDLTIIPMDKKASKGKISVTLKGQIILEDVADINSVDDKVRQLMNSLKNPSNLLSLLKKAE